MRKLLRCNYAHHQIHGCRSIHIAEQHHQDQLLPGPRGGSRSTFAMGAVSLEHVESEISQASNPPEFALLLDDLAGMGMIMV